MNNVNYNKLIVCGGKIIDTTSAKVMAIINATPDSFFSGSRKTDEKTVLQAAENAIAAGASILDIGGYSTRPGGDEVSETEEIARVEMALKAIRGKYPDFPISVDTFRSNVARIAVEKYNANIINDVSGFEYDKKMLETIVQLQVPYILMHNADTPMQSIGEEMLTEILQYFARKIMELRDAGFDKEIIIDPGFGFAKDIPQNYTLLRELHLFENFNAPILVGISRKRMIHQAINITADDALNGTTALNCFALERGANILRVHDVREACEAIKLHNLLYNKPL